MVLKPDTLPETASQTAGPYVHIGLMPSYTGNGQIFDRELGQSPIAEGAQGQIITITGAVFDGMGGALRDALIESWQADAQGRFAGQDGADPKVSGFCRFAADPATGEFTLRTVRPGPVALRDGRMQAPHISLWIVARGINTGLQTRIYFEDADNSADPLLTRVEHRARADTLIARKTGEASYRFDIRLQGPGETVFLDI